MGSLRTSHVELTLFPHGRMVTRQWTGRMPNCEAPSFQEGIYFPTEIFKQQTHPEKQRLCLNTTCKFIVKSNLNIIICFPSSHLLPNPNDSSMISTWLEKPVDPTCVLNVRDSDVKQRQKCSTKAERWPSTNTFMRPIAWAAAEGGLV